MAEHVKDGYNKSWIIENSVSLVLAAGEELTVRGLHYLLLPLGMPNTDRHYKRVVAAMRDARWKGLIPFDAFVDFEREVIGWTASDETNVDAEIDHGKGQIVAWMNNYSKNRWENQPIYPEVFIEKKTQIGVFRRDCSRREVALSPCKGYPSITFLYEAFKRFQEKEADGKRCVMLYFGDHDPSGDDIPRHIDETLKKWGCSVEVQRIALTKKQVIQMNLPPAPTKKTDQRSANWDGIGQVEMDAVKPEIMQKMLNASIDKLFNSKLGKELDEQEASEQIEYKEGLKRYVSTL